MSKTKIIVSTPYLKKQLIMEEGGERQPEGVRIHFTNCAKSAFSEGSLLATRSTCRASPPYFLFKPWPQLTADGHYIEVVGVAVAELDPDGTNSLSFVWVSWLPSCRKVHCLRWLPSLVSCFIWGRNNVYPTYMVGISHTIKKDKCVDFVFDPYDEPGCLFPFIPTAMNCMYV